MIPIGSCGLQPDTDNVLRPICFVHEALGHEPTSTFGAIKANITDYEYSSTTAVPYHTHHCCTAPYIHTRYIYIYTHLFSYQHQSRAAYCTGLACEAHLSNAGTHVQFSYGRRTTAAVSTAQRRCKRSGTSSSSPRGPFARASQRSKDELLSTCNAATSVALLLRGAILSRTYGRHKNLYI